MGILKQITQHFADTKTRKTKRLSAMNKRFFIVGMDEVDLQSDNIIQRRPERRPN